MSVYVDPLMAVLASHRWLYPQACHLIADSERELHLFASYLGLRRDWFQDHPGKLPHYDLTARLRAQAVAQGAIEITTRQMAEMIRTARRELGK